MRKISVNRVLCFLLVFMFAFSSLGNCLSGAEKSSIFSKAYAEEKNENEAVTETEDTLQEVLTNTEDGSETGSAVLEDVQQENVIEKEGTPSETKEEADPISFEVKVGESLVPIDIQTFADHFDFGEPLTDEELQNKYVRVVEHEDGTSTAEFHTTPIRYQDEDGKWNDIDATLESVRVNGETVLQAKAVSEQVEMLADDKTKDVEVQLNKDDISIAFEPIEAKTGEALESKGIQFVDVENNIASSELALKKDCIGVVYEEVFEPQTDMIVYSTTDGVKEEITLYDIPEQSDFSFEFNIDGVYPVLRTDGTVFFIADGTNEIKAYIPAPFMYDSAEEEIESYDIEVNLKKAGDSTYIYTLVPSREWLEADDRVYPVVIDPSVSFKDENSVDTFITKKYPDNNYSGDARIKVGNSSDLGISRGLVKFYNVMSTLGTNKYITDSSFHAYQDYSGSSSPEIGLYRVLETFNNLEVTWNTRPSIATAPYTNATTVVSSVGWYEWDTTELVEYWYETQPDVWGICIRNVDESVNKYKRFRSESYSSDDTYSPYLSITYYSLPTAPSSVTVSPTSWTKGNVTINWAGITQSSGATLSEVQYSTTSATSGFTAMSNSAGKSSGSAAIALPAGTKYVWVRGKNSHGQVGPAKKSSTQYKRDVTVPSTPATLNISADFAKTFGTVSANWAASTDAASGVDHYQIRLRQKGLSATSWGAWGSDKTATGTTCTYTNLDDNMVYQIAVRAYDAAGNVSEWKFSDQLSIGNFTPPTAPSTVTVSPTTWTNGNVTVSWSGITQASGATLSSIQYSTTSATSGFATISNPSGLGSGSASLALPEGTKYVWIRGKNSSGQVGTAKKSTAQYKRDVTAPSVPATISLAADYAETFGTLAVSWTTSTDAASGVDHYQVRLRQKGLDATSWGAWGNDKTPTGKTCTYTNLDDNVVYQIAVRAYDAVGNVSEWKFSDQLSIGNYTPPTAPSDVTVSPTTWTKDKITVSWTGLSQEEGSELSSIQYSTTSATSGFTTISNPSGLASGSAELSLPEGTKYVWIRGKNSDGQVGTAQKSSAQYKRDITAPTVPENFTVTESLTEFRSVELEWSASTDSASGLSNYQVGIKKDDGDWVEYDAGTALSYVFNNLGIVSEYSFKVRAVDNVGNLTSWVVSEPITIRNWFDITAISNIDNNAIQVAWRPSSETDAVYDLYRAVTDTTQTTPVYELVQENITTNKYFDTAVQEGKTYYYRVVEKFDQTEIYSDIAIHSIGNYWGYRNVTGTKHFETPLNVEIVDGNLSANRVGNTFYTVEDVNTSSSVSPVSLIREYNSFAPYQTAFGQHWDHNLNIAMIPIFTNTVEDGVLWKQGSTYYFFEKGELGYISPAGLYAELTKENNAYVLTLKDKTEYLFGTDGKISKIIDKFGKETVFAYDESGRLSTVTNAVGDQLELTYCTDSGMEHLISSATANGITKNYVYNAFGLLEAVYTTESVYDARYTYENETGNLLEIQFAESQTEEATEGEEPEEDVTTLYVLSYDNVNYLDTVTDPMGDVADIDFDGNTLTVSKNGYVTSQTYDANGNMSQQTVNGATTTFTYDENHNMLTSSLANGSQMITDTYQYDARGNITIHTNPAGKQTIYTYTAGKDVPSQVSEPFNGSTRKITHYTYEAYDLVTSSYVEGIDQKTFYFYDTAGAKFGNCVRTVSVTGVGATSLTSVPSGSSYYIQETLYEYDAKGRLEKTTQKGAVDRVQTTDYEETTNNVETETAAGVTTSYEYNADTGLVTAQTETGAANEAITTSYVYDDAGNVLTETTKAGSDVIDETESTYDALNRTVTSTSDGVKETITYSEVNGKYSETSISKNTSGEVVAKTVSVEDSENKKIIEGTGVVNANDKTRRTINGVDTSSYTENTYDSAGNVISSIDQSGMVTTYTYDIMGNKLSEMLTGTGMSETTTYTYDDAGNMLTQTDPDGMVTTYTYDVLGRQLSVRLSKGDNSIVTDSVVYDTVQNGQLLTVYTDAKGRTRTAAVDALGDLVWETNGTKKTSYTYDNAGQMLTSTLTDPAYPNEQAVTTFVYENTQLVRKSFADDHYIVYTYDDEGNTLTETVTDGDFTHTITYTYDDKGNQTSMTRGDDEVEYEYDDLNQLTKVSKGTDYVVEYAYNSDGQQTEVSLNGTLINQYEHDGMGNIYQVSLGNDQPWQTRYYTWDGLPAQIIYSNASNEDIERYELTYDDSDRIVSEKHFVGDAEEPETLKVYQYDWMGRLTHEAVNGVITTYSYDAVGNRLSMTSGGQTLEYTYNDNDQLLNIKNGTEIVARYTYDLSGNRISDGEKTYSFNEANQLTSVTTATELLGSYTYDATGQRLSDGATEYLYDGLNLLSRTTADDAEQYVYDANGNLIRMIADNTAYIYHKDVRGSIMSIYNVSGTKVLDNSYDAYGNTTLGTATIPNILAYTGAVIDEATGLYYMNARYYDPEIGAFISQDSYRGDGERFWHLYVYCGGDPVNYVDRNGNSATLALAGTMYAVAGANAWNPVGWVVAGVATGIAIAVGISYAKKKAGTKKDPDPYARPGQKKQGRERKNKARQKDNWKEKTKPKKPNKHTPGRDHRKKSKKRK